MVQALMLWSILVVPTTLPAASLIDDLPLTAGAVATSGDWRAYAAPDEQSDWTALGIAPASAGVENEPAQAGFAPQDDP